MDLLVAPKEVGGHFMVIVDHYSKYIFGEAVVGAVTTENILDTFNLISSEWPEMPKNILLDKQPAFKARKFVQHLVDQGVKVQFSSPERHGYFLGHAERAIRTLRQMSNYVLREDCMSY